MATKATLEAVRTAMQQLLANGLKVTSDNVLGITQGSKGTVVRHMTTVRKEMGQLPKEADPGAARLQEFALPLVREIWQAAKTQAEAEFHARLRTLVELHSGAAEDLEMLQGELEAAGAELEKERTRALDAERRLDAEVTQQEQMGRLIDMMEQWRPGSAGRIASGDTTDIHASKIEAVLRIVSTADEPIGRRQIDELLIRDGFEAGQANQARFHAMESGYIGLRLTAKGKARLSQLNAAKAAEIPTG